MTEPDRVDALVSQWKSERPDLDLDTMATAARLLGVAQLVNAGIETLAAEYGIDRGQGDVVFALRRAGPPYRLSPSTLSESLLVSSGTMTNRLDRLEQRGVVSRVPNPDDRRGMDVQLTPKGVRLAEEAVKRHVDNERRMLAPLSERERVQLDRIMRKLLAHLAPPAADGRPAPAAEGRPSPSADGRR